MPLSARRKPARRLPPEVLTTAEVNAIIAAIDGDTVAAVRNRALIAFLYRTGLRISEALSVYPKDIDPLRSAVRVLHGKGGRARTVGIDSAGLSMLTPWIERRAAMKLSDRHSRSALRWMRGLRIASKLLDSSAIASDKSR